MRTVAVEYWLRCLQRNDKKPLANGTKAKIRSLFSALFNHGIRYEWLGQGKSYQDGAAEYETQKDSGGLDIDQIKALLSQLKERYRLMVLLDLTTGLRRGELFGLKWGDIDFTQLVIDIQRSIYRGCIGPCKTEASRKPIPLDLDVAADVWLWKETAEHDGEDDWIFASSRTDGKYPLAPETVLKKVIRPAAIRAGIQQTIGWHTFRHTYLTLLIDQGGKYKGRSGIDATCYESLHPGDLFTGANW